MSPFMTYWSLMFAIADANCLGGDAKGATSSTGACRRACRARAATCAQWMICVDDMRDLFQYKSTFNGDIRNCNVVAVKNAHSMFYRDNSRWDVRAVRAAQQTFYSASAWEALTY